MRVFEIAKANSLQENNCLMSCWGGNVSYRCHYFYKSNIQICIINKTPTFCSLFSFQWWCTCWKYYTVYSKICHYLCMKFLWYLWLCPTKYVFTSSVASKRQGIQKVKLQRPREENNDEASPLRWQYGRNIFPVLMSRKMRSKIIIIGIL